jgi:regulator of PEP synthase PpsR (kinase-PPPase family)
MNKNTIKTIIISDGTGTTAKSIARAVITQYPNHEILFTSYNNVRDKNKIDRIINEASIHHDLILYTIVSKELREHIQYSTLKANVRSVDLLGPLLNNFSEIVDKVPNLTPGLLHNADAKYYQKVDALEFTLGHDDCQTLEHLNEADIVLIGISGTSKTPLSVFLSMEGLKVVNIPIIYQNQIPKQLLDIDQKKVFALTISAKTLLSIRQKRMNLTGTQKYDKDYASLNQIQKEIDWAEDIFNKHKRWPVFNVTDKVIESLVQEILEIINQRKISQLKIDKRFKESL